MKTSAFVDQMYTKFLGRSADAGGRSFWVGLLEEGKANAAHVALSLINSDEFAGLVTPIARLYYASFGRVPDAAGLAYWVANAKKGASMSAIAADFMRSTEFQTLYGKNLTDSSFLDLLYKNVLGRTPDADGKAYWLAKLTTDKVARPLILTAFSYSAELANAKNEEIKIIVEYQNIAGVTPSKTEIATALAQQDSIALLTKLFASSTYSGVQVPYFNQRGVVVDGYIHGARLFVDRNGNRVQDPNEIATSTDLQGNFSFKGSESFNGVLISQGGIDISIMRDNPLSYSAPSGSLAIGPLTTLVEKIAVSKKIPLPEAQAILNQRLSLALDTDVLQVDPIAQAVKPGASAEVIANALKAHQMAAEINLSAKLMANVLLATKISNDTQRASDAAFDALTRLLLTEDSTEPLDLSDAAVIAELLTSAALFASADTPSLNLINQIQADFAQLLANLNRALATAVDSDVMASLRRIAQIGIAADDIAKFLKTDVIDGDISASVLLTQEQTLADAISAAQPLVGQLIQDIVPPTLLSSSPADNATPVLANSNIVLRFSENVFAGSGNVVVSNGKDTRTIAVGDKTQITFHADTVTINPTADLLGGTNYYVTMDAGVIRDRVGNGYVGISDKTALNFGVPNTVIKLANMDGTNGTRYDGTAPAGVVSVASAGDMNADGFADFIVGSAADTNAGTSYVIFGKAAALGVSSKLSAVDGRSGFRIDGVTADDFSGSAVNQIGDINGDGRTDIIVGAPGADPGSKTFAGSSYVVFGKSTAFSSKLNLSTLDGKTGFRIDAANAGEWSGSALASAGDFNGDGLDDILIGASGSDNSTGAAYIVYGKSAAFNASLNLASLNGLNGFKMSGVGANDLAGSSVTSVGDFNGDGADDVLIGGLGANGDAGAAWLVFGKQADLVSNLNLSSLNGTNGVRFDGVAGENLGRSVAGIGDINADGLPDLAVGAFHADGNAGTTYVVYGKLNSFDPSFNLSQLDGRNGFKIHGEANNDLSGIAVSGAGDVNGDGFADMLIGARDARSNAGSNYLLFGKTGGFDADVYLSQLNGVSGMRLDGLVGDMAGGSASAAGDVNGDGYDDVVIGAQNALGGAGAAYLFLGGNFSSVVTHQGTVKADTLVGTSNKDVIIAGAANDIITTGGGADIVRAGAGDDIINISSLDFSLIDGGGGNDTLKFNGEGLDLNLALMSKQLHSIETFNILGTGDNSITITPQSVLDHSEYSNKITITGNSGDVVNLIGAWVPGTGKDTGIYTFGQAVVVTIGVRVEQI